MISFSGISTYIMMLDSGLRVIWCSTFTNMISTYDFKRNITYPSFRGTQLISNSKNFPLLISLFTIANLEGAWTFVEALPESNCLISLHHHRDSCANFEVIQSAKNNKRVFSFGEQEGSKELSRKTENFKIELEVGSGDVTCNLKTKMAALISVKDAVAYHLFDADMMTVVKEAKWQKKHRSKYPGYSVIRADVSTEYRQYRELGFRC